MAKIEIYTKSYCPFCQRAKALLDPLDVPYTEYEVLEQPEKLDEMLERSEGRRTVPQIFIDDAPIGGSDDLFALRDSGQLSRLLDLRKAS